MDLINILKDYQFYEPLEDNSCEKHISASSLADDPLQLWLKINNYQENEEDLGDHTLGSLVHMALESIVIDSLITDPSYDRKDWEMEQRHVRWVDDYCISGKMDLVDHKNKVLYDFKTGKNYSKESLKKEGKLHRYSIQLAVYNWLLGGGYTPKILWIMKDSNAVKHEPVFSIQQIEIMTPDEIVKYIRDKIAIVDHSTIEDFKTCAPWIRSQGKGKPAINTRCSYYCRYSGSCPLYNPTDVQKVKEIIW